MVKRICFILLALGLGMSVCGSSHAVVIEDTLMVTDVTPVQFCAVWATSEPAFGWLNVFLDPEATTPYTEAVVISESAEHPPAEDIGVMKVKMVGLKPDTEYFFQTETIAKDDNAVYLSPLERVRTEKASIIVRNDVFVPKVGIGENKSALGLLVIASVDKASYPVSGWVGDGVPDGWAAIDTNNFYDMETHVNLELEGGEVVNLMLFGGSLGSVETQETVPEEKGGIQPLEVAVNLPGSGSVPAISAPQDNPDEEAADGDDLPDSGSVPAISAPQDNPDEEAADGDDLPGSGSVPAISAPQDSAHEGGAEGGGASCFIATAAFSSP